MLINPYRYRRGPTDRLPGAGSLSLRGYAPVLSATYVPPTVLGFNLLGSSYAAPTSPSLDFNLTNT